MREINITKGSSEINLLFESKLDANDVLR